MVRYKVTVFQRKNKNKVRGMKTHTSLKRARHHARIAFASGFPVQLDKVKKKKKKR